MEEFHQIVYQEALKDQMDSLSVFYSHDKSMLMTLICEVWPEFAIQNLDKYPVMDQIFEVLKVKSISYEVVSLIFGLLKQLIGNSLVKKADFVNTKTSLKALGLKDLASERFQALKDGD